jgi:hypothetical protein
MSEKEYENETRKIIDELELEAVEEQKEEKEKGKGKTAEIVSKKVGMSSSRNYYRAKTIIEKAPEEVKQKLRNNNIKGI